MSWLTLATLVVVGYFLRYSRNGFYNGEGVALRLPGLRSCRPVQAQRRRA
ncbi:hypothetical protein AB1287_19515 [Enterobacter asburiae]